MRTLVIKSCFLFILIFATVSILNMFASEELDPDNYLAVTVDKHERLQMLESPKIVFVGDSSLAFGLDAKHIEETLNIPTSNMGLHAALGLEFTFKEIGGTIQKNDIVILSAHYYPNDVDINQGVICHTLDFHPILKQKIVRYPLDGIRLDLICKVKRIRRYALNKRAGATLVPADDVALVSETPPTVFGYSKSSFTAYGDIVDVLYEHSEINFEAELPDMHKVSQWKTMRQIQKLQRYVEKQGASLYFVFPPYPKSKYEQNSVLIEQFADTLRNKTGIKILGSPVAATFSNDMFFNSDYHLTSFGKKEYTNRIIELLRNSFVDN